MPMGEVTLNSITLQHQGHIGDREGELERGVAWGRGVERTWPGRDRGYTTQAEGG